ncbi:MAG: NAD(P)H-dependent oxidoreductase [Limosilactobacillus sp.]|uniref:NAD(P)H-dependent oxidoreductase n=1 Tax=Limosilactobacillus sp. TaxID=2773925 RepID=UPI00271053F1|nr:NAD(P)H-dependent oxidoreductase [Limosilactobacillus sp.]
MKKVINLFHPNFAGSRVNKALVKAAEDAGFEVRDMYKLYPDFKIDVKAEQKVFEEADRMVWEFPVYWYSAPALFHQYAQDVFEYGWAYGHDATALHGKELLIATTVGAHNYGHDNFVKYDVHEIFRPFQAISRLLGTTYLKPFEVIGASTIDDDQLAQAAKDYVEYLNSDDVKPLGDYE